MFTTSWALGTRQGVSDKDPALVKLMFYGGRWVTNKQDKSILGYIYKGNKQGHQLNLLDSFV